MVAADRSVKKWAGFLERRAAKFWGHISVTWESDVFQGEKKEREKQEESWRIAKKWAFLEISFSSPFFVWEGKAWYSGYYVTSAVRTKPLPLTYEVCIISPGDPYLGEQITQASSLRNTEWATHNCVLGYPVIGK